MSTRQSQFLVGSLAILSVFASECAAQVVYVRDGAGYVHSVVIPQSATFSLGMQVTPVVSPNGMFVQTNVMPFGLSMPDPSTTTFMVVPGPNLGVFDGGIPQAPMISAKQIVIPVQGQVGFGGFGFGGQPGLGMFGFAGQPGVGIFGQPAIGAFGFQQGFAGFGPMNSQQTFSTFGAPAQMNQLNQLQMRAAFAAMAAQQRQAAHARLLRSPHGR
jgi:hypothetical protein